MASEADLSTGCWLLPRYACQVTCNGIELRPTQIRIVLEGMGVLKPESQFAHHFNEDDSRQMISIPLSSAEQLANALIEVGIAIFMTEPKGSLVFSVS